MFRRIAAGWLSIGLVAATAHAQDFPTRTLTMIVPFAAGGAADVTGRILAEGIGRQLGQNVIVENVSGAGGTIGATRGKNAPADGYTISLGHMGTHAAAPALYPRLGYDPRKDFEYLGLIAKSPIILFARKTLPAKTLTDFIAYAKKEGPKLKNGHSGVGSISHITCALFDQLVDIKPTSVPYRGVGPMMNDMLGDNVDYGCDLVAALSPQVKSGNIMGLAVAAPQRAAAGLMCRPPSRLDCRISRPMPGRPCSYPRARPSPRSRSCAPRQRRPSTIRPCATGSRPLARPFRFRRNGDRLISSSWSPRR
jgi:tripartite-type tricarboxylate transporter receptor subunit TctC